MNPSIIAFVIFALMLAISDVLAVKSKAILDSMLTFSVLLCVAFWCGMPYDYVTDSGFLPIAYVCLALLLTNMGSCISFNQFVQEWKTVVIGFVMVAVICVSVYFTGSIFIDKLYAYAGAPVVAGSFVSYLTMAEPLKEAGLNDVAAFCLLTMIAQSIVGIPFASLLVKKEAKRFIDSGEYKSYVGLSDETTDSETSSGKKRTRFIPQFPEKYNKSSVLLAKLGLVAMAGCGISAALNGELNFLCCCLIVGVVFAQIGFLDQDALHKAGADGLVMLIAVVYAFESVYQITPSMFVSLVKPFLVVMAIGILTILVGGLIIGKLFRISYLMTTAIGLTALFGFPATYYIAMEVAEACSKNSEEKNALEKYLVPKLMVAGFATVSIGSVIAASVMLPGLMARI